jgi:hypothetical protein
MRFRITLVRLIFIPILSFVLIIFLSNGIRELIIPEWEGLISHPGWVTIIAYGELMLIVFLCVISIYCLVVLYYVLTKHVSVDQLEKALNDLKKRE